MVVAVQRRKGNMGMNSMGKRLAVVIGMLLVFGCSAEDDAASESDVTEQDAPASTEPPPNFETHANKPVVPLARILRERLTTLLREPDKYGVQTVQDAGSVVRCDGKECKFPVTFKIQNKRTGKIEAGCSSSVQQRTDRADEEMLGSVFNYCVHGPGGLAEASSVERYFARQEQAGAADYGADFYAPWGILRASMGK